MRCSCVKCDRAIRMPKRQFVNEGDVKAEVKKLLKARGWMFWMPPANGYGRTGIADIHALRGGTYLAIETKFGGNVPTPMQVEFLRGVETHGGIAMVVDETTLPMLLQWLDAFDRSVESVQHRVDVAVEDGAAMLNALKVLTEPFHA